MTSRKTAPPDVLFVNGASSAGKTSLIRAVQDLVPVPYLHVGLECWADAAMMHYRRLLWRPAGWRMCEPGPSVESWGHQGH